MRHFPFALLLIACLLNSCQSEPTPAKGSAQYSDLIALFKNWRSFEAPPLRDEAPDYSTATFQKRQPEFNKLQAQLLAMDTSKWTIPRGWMKTEPELRIFEQHLYLRQPVYGTSYLTGKYLIEQAMMDFARLKELKKEPFQIKEFLDRFNAMGNIPVSLGHWEMTGVEAPISGN